MAPRYFFDFDFYRAPPEASIVLERNAHIFFVQKISVHCVPSNLGRDGEHRPRSFRPENCGERM